MVCNYRPRDAQTRKKFFTDFVTLEINEAKRLKRTTEKTLE